MIYRELPPEGAQEPIPIGRDAAYVSVVLKYANMAAVRKGLKRFYGVVHSAISLPVVGGASRNEFSSTFAPAELKGRDARGFSHLISLDQPLFGPVPYRGGRLAMDVGLYSVEEANLLEPYLGLLEAVSKAATVCYTGPAAVVAEPLRRGVLDLLGADRGDKLEVGCQKTWSPPRQGRIVVLLAAQGEDFGPLAPREDGRVFGADGRSILDRSYLVLEISAAEHRDQWFNIPELADLHQRIRDRHLDKDGPGRHAALERFRLFATASDDLLPRDADLICDEVEARWNRVPVPRRSIRGSGEAVRLPELREMDPFNLRGERITS